MNAMAEIDEGGRLVVPKKMRDTLHLVPDTRLVLSQKGGSIVLQPESKPRGLCMLACARKAKANRIYTLNQRHFRLIAPDLAPSNPDRP